MTRIDPNRIADIFRSLSTKKAADARMTKQASDLAARPEAPTTPERLRDPELLRQRLRHRLLRLKSEVTDFAEMAPETAIREVLIWEFGDSIVNHPEFNQVAATVAHSMRSNERVNLQLRKLIDQVTEK